VTGRGGRALGAAGAAGRSLAAAARVHWQFSVLFAAGLVLRVFASLAYRPALIFTDSIGYLANMSNLGPRPLRPFGYPVFLRILPLRFGLEIVPLVQHLMGLGMAICIYALLIRLGVGRWLAAIATAPVLLDAMQLNLEQQVLSETLFQALLLAGCVLLLWRPRPGLVLAALAGLSLSAAVLTRSVAELVIVPAVLVLLLVRARLVAVGALVAAFAVPLLVYAAWFHADYGIYALNGLDGHFLYARVAPFADCKGLQMPSYERELCPKPPVGHRLTVEQFSWSSRSPIYHLQIPANLRTPGEAWLGRSQIAGDFAERVIENQPLTYAETVASDFLRGFWPTRTTEHGEVPVQRWMFKLHYPVYGSSLAVLRRYGEHPAVSHDLAVFLHAYQRVGYTPGPLLGVALILGILGALGVGRARRSGLQCASLLFTGAALIVLVTAVGVNQFSWRYQLPGLVLLPAAGALGLTALLGRAEPAAAAAPQPRPAAGGRPPLSEGAE
jgi:4-amino-4-deoxy-L-arabinose transferase-like glycosyltransferase